MFESAALFFLLQAAELRRSAHSCLLSYWNLPYCVPQKFDKALDGQLPVGRLAVGLLRYYQKETVFPDTIPKAAHD